MCSINCDASPVNAPHFSGGLCLLRELGGWVASSPSLVPAPPPPAYFPLHCFQVWPPFVDSVCGYFVATFSGGHLVGFAQVWLPFVDFVGNYFGSILSGGHFVDTEWRPF